MSARETISKASILKSISEMSDQITMEELFDRIIYLFKIETGLEESKRGEGASLDQVRENVKTWRLAKSS